MVGNFLIPNRTIYNVRIYIFILVVWDISNILNCWCMCPVMKYALICNTLFIKQELKEHSKHVLGLS